MSREELWGKFVERNPSFDGEGSVTLSAKGLRKLFRQTWDFGFEEGVASEVGRVRRAAARAEEEMLGGAMKDDSKLSDLMRIFGMKK